MVRISIVILSPKDDFVGRKYSAFADESHIGEARVAKSSGKVLTESPDEKNNNQNFPALRIPFIKKQILTPNIIIILRKSTCYMS